jgi:hypothetical protein
MLLPKRLGKVTVAWAVPRDIMRKKNKANGRKSVLTGMKTPEVLSDLK